ncbi:MAG: response regulator transcription factor [Chloroflexota bacterium]|jgi:DNA-binding NarL/FixJ family response regulator
MKIFRALLADDHELIRAGLKQSLANLENIEIVGEAGNGIDLFQLLRELSPDLLVVDLNMPDFEPVSDVFHIRQQYPLLKIIVVSAYDDQSYVIGLLSAGVDGYHLKDQPLADLQLAVKRVTAGGRWISDPLVNRLVEFKPAVAKEKSNLTRRQRELLYLLYQGYNNPKIASIMDLSIKTVENHLTALYRSIGVDNRLEANNFSRQHPELLVPPTKHRETSPESDKIQTNHVLLVDNNARYRTQLGKLLLRNNPKITLSEAEDSIEAVDIAAHAKPQIAFIDVILGDEDGIGCVKKMKLVSPRTKMILMSAYPDREFHRLGINAGAVAFLDKKDIDAATIRQVLEDLLS